MGVAAIALLALLIAVVVILWRNYLRTRDRTPAALALGLLTITVNGIFQEEALFSPLALGLMLALCGTALGRDYRRVYQDPRLILSRQDKAAISGPNSLGTSAQQHG
jgi:O-antigen ligase